MVKENRMNQTVSRDTVKQRYPLHYRIAKRVFDLVSSAIALVLVSPVMLLICLLIKLDSKGPAMFVHERYGKDGKPLRMLKFRTMYENAQDMIAEFTPEQRIEWESNFKLADDPRITKVGKILRKTSLDELPQLINILRGDMSVVGPRPIITEELEMYGERKEKFLSAAPGLTGYWQAYARSDCSYEQRMKMELHYVDNANFWWDMKIIIVTFFAVIRGKGAR